MHKFFYEQRRAFSFRKLTIGLVSLCVGTSLLFGIQSQEVSASTVSPSQIRFEYVLEAELSAEERQLIQSSLPAELKEEATYFVVYRPSKKVLPATGELAGSGLAVLGLGFLVLAVSATKSKKARVLTMLYVTTSGLVLPVLEVGAVQSSALAAYNQTLTIRPGDSLPDGKLRLDGYEFVGYFIEEKSEVKSQARDEKTSLSTSNQLEEPKTNPETAEVDKQISTGEVSGKPDQESQPIVEQADKAEETGQTEQADKAEETGQTEQADKTEQTGKAEESQDQAAQSTEAAVEEKLITTIPTEAPIHLLPTIDFQVQDKVEEIALEIPEEQIETNQLPLGQSRVEAGQAGSLRISYQEVLVDGQVVARKETSREEIPSIPRKVYIGTGQVVEGEVTETDSPEEPVQPTEEPVEEKLITTIPTEAPIHHLPTIDFQVRDKVEEIALEIPEEQIETEELAIGQRRVEEGQAGSLRISYQEVLVDGQIVARNEISREEIPSIPKRTYIGTRRDEKYVAPEKLELPRAIIRTQEEEIAFERKEVLRADWPPGKVEVVAGKNGKRLHTYAVIEGVETLLKTEVLEQAEAEITYKGVNRPETTTEEIVIDFTERVISDAEQYTDYRQIEVTGEQGLKRLHKENGQLVNEEIVKPAKEQVVRVGTKPIEGQVEKESLCTIDFARRYESNDQLEYGQTRTKQPGQSGQEKVISAYQTIKGVEGQLLSSRTVSVSPVQDEIIEVGTKPQIRIEQEEPVTEYVPAPDKERNVQTVLQEGHAKETIYRTVYNLDTNSGQVMPIQLPGTVSHPGQVRRISVGTKPTITKKALPFTEETIPNSTLYVGERVIVRPGRAGEEITTVHYTLNPRTGETSASQPQIQEIAAVTQVVQVGTKAVDRTVETVDSRDIAFKTEYRADSTLPYPQREELQVGSNGVERITTTRRYVRDQEVGEPTRVNEVVKVVQNRIIKVGTKPAVRRVETDFTRVYEADSNRSLNERHVKQSGIKQETTYTKNYVLNTETGTVTEQAETSQVTRSARQEIVQVGTRPTTETTSRVLPTRYEADITRAYGQQYISQQGRPEITTYTTTYRVDPRTGSTQGVRDTGRVTDSGQEQIIQVGTQPVERTERIELPEIRRQNANLAKDTETVIYAGSPTIRLYRTSYTVNPDTGQLTALQEVLVSEIAGRAREVEIGAKEPEQLVTPPVENEGSCPIVPDNTDGGTCEAPTEPAEKPSSPDLECILNPTDQCWPEEEETVNPETVAQLRAKMEKLMSYRSRFRNPSWHTYIDAVYNESEKIIQSGVAADIRTQLDAIDADLEFVIDAQIPKISTDANSGASRAENIELITDANGGTAPRYEDNPTPVTPNPDQGSGTEKPVETPIPPVPPVDQEQPVPPVNPPVTPIPELEQPRPGIPDAKPVVPDTPPVAPDSQPATPVPEPEQPNISETEPVSPEKSEETTEETVEDVNKPLLRVLKNEPHYHLMKHVRSSKVTYKLDDQYNTFRKAIARLFVNDIEIHQEELTDKNKLEVRFRNLLPNVDYFVKTDLVYTDSNNAERTERLMDEVHIDFEERHFEIKNIDEAEVWKNENGKLVRKVALKVDPIDVQNYFIKLKSDEHKDIFLQVKDIDEIRINGERHFKLQAKFTNPEERRQKLDKYHDTVTVYLPREVRENRETRNKYSTFTSLLNAMKTNSSGTFELQQDLTASEVVLSDTDKSYLAGHFYGTLRGNGFTIHDLKVPLFDDLRGTVSDLNLKAVDIHLPKEAEVGALAKQSDNATVSNVHAQGRINAKDKIGGIIGESFKTNMKNISFRGELASVTNESNNLIGGLAGWLGGGKIEKGYVDATISSASSNVKAGGLVGQLENDNTRITSSFATGTIISTKNKDTEVGGLVGAVLQGNNIRIADSIAAVKAVNGHKVYGENQQGESIFSNIKVVENLSSGEDNPNIGFATSEDVKAIVEDRGLIKSHSSLNVFNEKNVFDIDYTKEGFTRTDRKQAYENMEKLLPFFTRDVIIQHANRLESSDSLVTKKLVDVVPMIDKTPVFDIIQNKDDITRLLLHFEDGTTEKHYLVKKKELGSGAVVEYHLLDKNISYTPETYVRNTDIGSMIFELQNQFGAIQFKSDEVNKVLGLPAYQPEKERQLLFLEESFERVKSNISTHLTDLISNYNLVGLDNSAIREYLKSYISKNKVQLLLGLAYMDKWYNIQFGDVNAKNLMMKKADFFGQNVNSLDQLIRIGSMGAEMLKPKNNYALASQVIAKESIGGDLFDYLEGYRKAFAPDKTTNDWFRTTTKATIIETNSRVPEVLEKQTNPTKDIYKNGFYDKMASNHWMYKEMALILLAMPSKDIFILTDMANTLIGTYAKLSGSDTDKENRLKQIAKEWAGHADYLYNILPEAHKEKMFRRVVTWDNKKINGSWKNSTTPSYYDLKVPAMKHFYIPLGHKHDYTATGAHADYTIDNIYYFEHEATSDDGARVYTHEMTHVADDDTILLGHGKRTSLDYEVYARGLFESITWGDQDRLGLNTIYDFSPNEQQRYGRRLTNLSPERFKSSKDLQDYMKGYLDVIYTLDLLEAEAVLATPNSYAKQNWFNQLETQDRNSTAVKQANRTPATLDQLIDSGMVSKRSYGLGAVTTENAYLVVNSFNPLYGSLNNDGTSRNEYEVRKIAFELLAEYGYENGMVPYLSNQYQAELGKSGTEYGRIRDDELISKITASTYSNSAAFRKAMFEKRRQDLEKLKSVTLIGTGIQNGEGYFYGGTRTVSASELRQLMREAVEYDANNNKYYSSNGHDVREQSRVYSLKAAVLNGYLRETKDFRESIYVTNP
ncbi:ZmpA/ZmpB/ZmpC family metallo-endopeptidase [Streptococcus suis]|uniref:ZmpA/ZmpB/ZmpC family metallo-endopeptidase n=3 Tax=Streptococcus suis TaxID=1307 RepID=UPI0015828F53|nr:ZmpA/ZmpB/ZmpC family metallo-endopeptidase [Streptococcus suis]